MHMSKFIRSSILLLLAHATSSLAATDAPIYQLTLKDHKFSPAELTIPANTKVKVSVKNLDATAAEFESKDFKVEKTIAGGKEASFFIGPLKAGSYEFHDEFHEDVSKSRLIVK